MFEGFERHCVELGDTHLNVVTGGAGSPLLLLHGYPESHVCWHAVAPRLAEHFALVIPDLPGYGDSRGPEPDPENLAYSKRAMAKALLTSMGRLGHEDFFLAGHDRGGRVAYRMALDAPTRVRKLASLDVIPTIEIWEAMDWRFALAAYHWPFLAQPAPTPERLIGGDPELYLNHLLDRWAGRPDALDPEARALYLAAFRKASVIAATCADYRAGAGVDVEHDAADRAAGRRLACPLLILRGARYEPEPLRDIWLKWADDVTEVALDCGHFIAEEQPAACAEALTDFFLD